MLAFLLTRDKEEIHKTTDEKLGVFRKSTKAPIQAAGTFEGKFGSVHDKSPYMQC